MSGAGTPGRGPAVGRTGPGGAPDAGTGALDAGPEGPLHGTQGDPRVSDDDAAPRRLTGGEAVRAHLTLALGLALCAVAFWFEVRRALGGNGLSWAYVFEWPLFAAFAVYMWWNVLHGDRAVRRRRAARPGPALDPRYAGMLAAWEAHQRELQASRTAAERPSGPGAGSGTDGRSGSAPGTGGGAGAAGGAGGPSGGGDAPD